LAYCVIFCGFYDSGHTQSIAESECSLVTQFYTLGAPKDEKNHENIEVFRIFQSRFSQNGKSGTYQVIALNPSIVP